MYPALLENHLRALDEIRASLSCLIGRSSKTHFTTQVLRYAARLFFRPSFRHSTLRGKAFAASYAVMKAGRYRSPLDNTAHVIRASL